MLATQEKAQDIDIEHASRFRKIKGLDLTHSSCNSSAIDQRSNRPKRCLDRCEESRNIGGICHICTNGNSLPSVVPDVLYNRLSTGFVRHVVYPDMPSAFGCEPRDIGADSPAATSDKQYAHVSHFPEVAVPPMRLMMTRAKLAAPLPSRASSPLAPSCP